VKCIMRFYNCPNTRLEERQQVATYRRGDYEVVYMIKGNNMVTQAPRFGYTSNQDAQEDLPKALNPVTNDVPAVAAFNRVFPMGDTNCDVAVELIPDLLRAIWARRPTIIIPFGQSGSGKTHTLEGDDDVAGLIPRLIDSTLLMIDAVRPATCIIMAQFAQVYKDKRIDLLVEDGDVVLGNKKPWPILIIQKRERKLGYTTKNGDVYEGFLIDDEMACYDADGKLLGNPIKEYKKTLSELVCQSLKEKHTPQELRQFQIDDAKPDKVFHRLAMRLNGVQKDMLLSIHLWYAQPPNNPVVQKAQKSAFAMVKNLIEYLSARSFVSKSDFSNQVQHVPIDGFCLKRIQSTEEFITMWRKASERRVTASTSNNETSSRATLTGKLSIVWSHPIYKDQPLPLALSTITFDDLPGAESAGDFTIADPLYKTRTLETNDIGSDLLKLGLLLGRQTAPSGRKVSEDIRSIDDKQAVTAIILTGKTNHSDCAQTLRFGHHAGTTLVHEIHLQEATKFLECIWSYEPADIIASAKEIWEELVPDYAPDLLQRLTKALGTGPVSAKKLTTAPIWHILSGVISFTICKLNPEEDTKITALHIKKRYQPSQLAPTLDGRGRPTNLAIRLPSPRGAPSSPPVATKSPPKKAFLARGSNNLASKQRLAGFARSVTPPGKAADDIDSDSPRDALKRSHLKSTSAPASARGARKEADALSNVRDTSVYETGEVGRTARKQFEKKRLTEGYDHQSDETCHRLDLLYERAVKSMSSVEKTIHQKVDHLVKHLEHVVDQCSDEGLHR